MKVKDLQMIFAKRVKLHRTNLNMAQGDLAKKSKLSQSTIAQIESGRKLCSMQTLCKISTALNIGVTVLLTDFTIEIRSVDEGKL